MSNFASSLLATVPVVASQSPAAGSGSGDVLGGLFESLLASLAGEGGVAISPETGDAGDPATNLSQGAPDPTQVAMPPVAGVFIAPTLTFANVADAAADDGAAPVAEKAAAFSLTPPAAASDATVAALAPEAGSPTSVAPVAERMDGAPDPAAPVLSDPRVSPPAAEARAPVVAQGGSQPAGVESSAPAADLPASASPTGSTATASSPARPVAADAATPARREPLPVTAPFEAASLEELAARGFRTGPSGATSPQVSTAVAQPPASPPAAAEPAPQPARRPSAVAAASTPVAAPDAAPEVAPSRNAEAPRATAGPTTTSQAATATVVEASLDAPVVAAPAATPRAPAAADPRKGPATGLKDRLAAPSGVSAPASQVGQAKAAADLSPVEAAEAALAAAADGPGAPDATVETADPASAPAQTPMPPQDARAPSAPVPAQAATGAEAAPRGAPETVAKLAADIVHKLEGKSTRFDLELAPDGLGRVDVSVEIAADGSLTASLSFDSAQAAADLRGRSGELRQALEQAGFSLTDDGLSFDLSGQDSGRGWSGAQAGDQERSWSGGRAFRAVQAGLDEADLALSAAPSEYARTPAGGVDIRI